MTASTEIVRTMTVHATAPNAVTLGDLRRMVDEADNDSTFWPDNTPVLFDRYQDGDLEPATTMQIRDRRDIPQRGE